MIGIVLLTELPEQLLGPDKHRKCEARWTTDRSQVDEYSIQCDSHHFLRLLLDTRATHQRFAQEVETKCLHPPDNGGLGMASLTRSF